MSGNLQKIEEALEVFETIKTHPAWTGGPNGGFKELQEISLSDCFFHNFNKNNKDVFDPIRHIAEGASHLFYKGLAEELKDLKSMDNIELDSLSLTPLYRAIPKGYIEDYSYYFFLEGNFYRVKLSNPSLPDGRNYFTIANLGKTKPDTFRIVDIKYLHAHGLKIVGGNINAILDAYNNYAGEMQYDPSRYVVEREVVKEVSDKYDPEYSLTKEETKRMIDWQEKHSKKYHKKGACSGGASPVSFYNISYGCCSIGSWWECTCTDCKEKGKPREVYQYEIRSDF